MTVIQHRQALHQIPELDRDLPKTLAYLEEVLTPLGCTLSRPCAGCLCAFFDFGRSDAVAFRSDADALPIQEETGLPYASRHPGQMHACGHDGHMAMLLDLAQWLSAQAALPHNILLVFQGAEETTGGARDLCESGIFEARRVRCIFGMHLWPDLPAGVIASRKNELMSRSCEVSVEVLGRSSHIAKASEGIDALAAGVAFYRRALALEQSLPPEIFRLLKFGRMESGTVRNAVSGRTVLLGSLRAFQDEVFFGLRDGLRDIAQAVEAESRCTVTVHTNDGYPAVWNPPALFDAVCRWGLSFQTLDAPVMIAEDFSWYQRHLPGLFFFLGTGPSPALHAAGFSFQEELLQTGAAFWKDLVSKLPQDLSDFHGKIQGFL